MFDFLNGEIVQKEIDYIVLMVSNIGYRLNVSKNTLISSLDLGKTQKFYTYLYVREDNLELFGFIDKLEHDCFKLLISVSGIGPKVAISMLSDLSVDKLYSSICSNDIKTLTNCQGIGPKTAQRIVLELRDKVTKLGFNENVISSNVYVSNNSINEDALNALMALGYSKSESSSVLNKVDSSLSTSDIIKSALKIISSKG